jgi:hypothetical protein
MHSSSPTPNFSLTIINVFYTKKMSDNNGSKLSLEKAVMALASTEITALLA